MSHKEFNVDGEEYKDLLAALKDRALKHTALAEVAAKRAETPKFKKNAKALHDTHKWKAQKADSLIKKLVYQTT